MLLITKLFAFFSRFTFTRRVALANFLIIHIPLIGTALLYTYFGESISTIWMVVTLVGLTLLATFVSMLVTKKLLEPFYLLDHAVKSNADEALFYEEEEKLADEIYRISTKTLKYIQSTKKRMNQQANLQALLSHDLRGPSSTVISLCELAKDERDIDVLQEYLSMIGETSMRQLKLQDELLQAQLLINSEQPERLDFREMIDKVLKEMSSSFRSKRIHIETKVAGTVSAITWPIIVKEALCNLLENAVKFSEEGSNIAIEAHYDGTHCLIDVSDQGIGIPEEMQDAIFFVNSPAGRIGTKGEASSGNGLYLSRNLMRSINGEIAVANSEVGNGTTMRLTIPG